MFAIVKLNQQYPVGTCVIPQNDNVWIIGGGHSFGVVESACEIEGDNIWARVRLAGETLAIADLAIPDQGGPLAVNSDTGRVYVGNIQDACGIVSPRSRGESSISEGDLVYIYIR